MIDCIRRFSPDDTEQIVAINNATWPGYPTTVAEMRASDHYHDRHSRTGRWVAEKCGRVVAVAQHDQLDARTQPRTYWIEINVHPDHQRQGIGGALYVRLMEELKAFDPALLRAVVGEEREDALHFFRARGFEELWRVCQAHLDFDAASDHACPMPLEISLLPLADLAVDPARNAKLYRLHRETREETSLPGLPIVVSQEQYVETVLPGLETDPCGALVAVASDSSYVGLVIVQQNPADRTASLEWLGVRQEMRGQGIGGALLSRALSLAKAGGAHSFQVTLNSEGGGLSHLCDRFGFTRPPALVHLVNAVK